VITDNVLDLIQEHVEIVQDISWAVLLALDPAYTLLTLRHLWEEQKSRVGRDQRYLEGQFDRSDLVRFANVEI